MKKLLFGMTIALSLLTITNSVSAITSNREWSSNIGYYWEILDNQDKTTNTRSHYLNWIGAEASNFNLWFKVRNTDSTVEVNKFLVTCRDSDSRELNTVKGQNYTLTASRENFYNPPVRCNGTWRVN